RVGWSVRVCGCGYAAGTRAAAQHRQCVRAYGLPVGVSGYNNVEIARLQVGLHARLVAAIVVIGGDSIGACVRHEARYLRGAWGLVYRQECVGTVGEAAVRLAEAGYDGGRGCNEHLV